MHFIFLSQDLHALLLCIDRGFGAQQFHHRAGELHSVKVGTTYVRVEGDINGDGRADFQMDVHNLSNDLHSLAKGDFIL